MSVPRLMKLLLLLTLLPAVLCAQVKAPAWASSLTKSAPGSFAPLAPCRVVFDLSWNNLVSAGSAKVVMQEAGGYQVARAEAGTSGFARSLWSYDCDGFRDGAWAAEGRLSESLRDG